MINALTELIKHLKDIECDLSDIKFLGIALKRWDFDEGLYYVTMTSDEADWVNKLDKLVYDNGFGEQKLFGYVLYNDAGFSHRHVCEGAEKWVHIPRMRTAYIKEYLHKLTQA